MRSKAIGVLVLVLILALALFLADAISPVILLVGVSAPTLIYSRYRQPSNDVKNLRAFLKSVFDGRVFEFNLKEITKPGDNSISKIRGLQVKLLRSNCSNEVETLQLAFKTMRPDRDIAVQSKIFMKEINFYSDIIPAIEQFQEIVKIPKSERIDAFIRYFGSRLSLQPDAKSADADVILLLENVKSLNYVSPNLWDRFDKDEAIACLKQLAKLHALLIAMRLLQPTLYYSKVDPHMHTVYEDSAMENVIEQFENFYDSNLHIAVPNMPSNVRSAFEHQLERNKEYLRKQERVPDTPYTTFYHRDVWIKNFVIKRDQTGEEISMRIFDFQGYDYNSFAFDLLQFLFFNVRVDDLKMHFTTFVEYYLSEFVNVMRIVNCPLNDYTNEKMWNEIKVEAKLNLINLYLCLALEKHIIETFNSSTLTEDHDSNRQNFTLETVFNRWKCFNELFIEHGFIVVD